MRRVESESVQADKDQLARGSKIDAHRVIRDRHRKPRLRGKVLFLMMPALTLAVAVWVAFQYGPFAVSKASTAPSTVSRPEKEEAALKEEFQEEPGKGKQSDPPRRILGREKNFPSKATPDKQNPVTLAAKATPTREETPPIEDPELKVQAIAWSESTENCFAVINGVIVRAGGKVEGVSVIEIGTDYVLFKSNERTWKIRMMSE